MRRLKIFTFLPKAFLITLGMGILVVFTFSLGRWTASKTFQSSLSPAPVELAVQKKDINKELSLELKTKDPKAKPEKIKYEVVSAETVGEIIVKGQKVKSPDGKKFLIFTLKITNEGTKAIQIYSRDFIRLSLGLKEEWIAPDIHSDPVEVQAISTKYTRVGFPVSNAEKQFRVRVGKIDGEKVDLDINF